MTLSRTPIPPRTTSSAPPTTVSPTVRPGLPPPATTAGSAPRRRAMSPMTPARAQALRDHYRDQRRISSGSGSESRTPSRGSNFDELSYHGEFGERSRSPRESAFTPISQGGAAAGGTGAALYPDLQEEALPLPPFPVTTATHSEPDYSNMPANTWDGTTVNASEPVNVEPPSTVYSTQPNVYLGARPKMTTNRGYGLNSANHSIVEDWSNPEPVVSMPMPRRTSTGLYVNQPGVSAPSYGPIGMPARPSWVRPPPRPEPQWDPAMEMRNLKDSFTEQFKLLEEQSKAIIANGSRVTRHGQAIQNHEDAVTDLTGMIADLQVSHHQERTDDTQVINALKAEIAQLRADMQELRNQRPTATTTNSEPTKPFNYRDNQFDKLQFKPKDSTEQLKALVTWKSQIEAAINANVEIQRDLRENPTRVFFGIQICQHLSVAQKLRQVAPYDNLTTLGAYFKEVERVVLGANSREKAQAALAGMVREKNEDVRTFLDRLVLVYEMAGMEPDTNWAHWQDLVFTNMNDMEIIQTYIKDYMHKVFNYREMVDAFVLIEGDTSLGNTYSGKRKTKPIPAPTPKAEPMEVGLTAPTAATKCLLCKEGHPMDKCKWYHDTRRKINEAAKANPPVSKSTTSSSHSNAQAKPSTPANNGNQKKKTNTPAGQHLGHVQGETTNWGSKNATGGN